MGAAFPAEEWERVEPEQAGIDGQELEAIRLWHSEQAGDRPYRVVVVRGGIIAAEWQQGLSAEERRGIASAL
ncbi:MAG: hypothetical protein ACYS1C_05790 [Planctomycetota bacterium]